jgi:hypothetical protein
MPGRNAREWGLVAEMTDVERYSADLADRIAEEAQCSRRYYEAKRIADELHGEFLVAQNRTWGANEALRAAVIEGRQ